MPLARGLFGTAKKSKKDMRSAAPRPPPRERRARPRPIVTREAVAIGEALEAIKNRAVLNPEKARHAIKLIELGGLNSPKVATTIITTLGRCGEAHHALEAFARVPKPDLHIYTAAIAACEGDRDGARWARAIALLGEMRERGVKPNITAYTAAISACEKGEQWERALALLDEMLAHDIPPEVEHYNAALKACAAAKWGARWERALELLDEVFPVKMACPVPVRISPLEPIRVTATLLEEGHSPAAVNVTCTVKDLS